MYLPGNTHVISREVSSLLPAYKTCRTGSARRGYSLSRLPPSPGETGYRYCPGGPGVDWGEACKPVNTMASNNIFT
jgi:hypothetical protein